MDQKNPKLYCYEIHKIFFNYKFCLDTLLGHCIFSSADKFRHLFLEKVWFKK